MLEQASDTKLKEPTETDGYPKITGFPTVFKVCEKHKQEFFKNYDNARTDIDGNCVICFPPDNDSLGG